MVGERGHLLVVDDSRVNRMKLSRSLEQQGYTVALAEDGQQALHMLVSTPFDLVLLDILMPEMDGFEVLEHMKQDDLLRDIPVIMISAMDEFEGVIRCIELGAEDYLTKPFDPIMLKARIGASLEKKRLRDEVAQQLTFISDIFGKYVPESVAKSIVADKGMLKPEQRVATILFTDIEGFTPLAESMEPVDVVTMLNEYFDAIAKAVTRYHGVINQFQGDAILATFNIPLSDPDHGANAVRAALEIQEIGKTRTFAGVSLHTRVGINTGEVVAGSVGGSDRLNYTVHGDAVNLAARLEQLNKAYGSSILVSESTTKITGDGFPYEAIGTITVPGKKEPVGLFKLSV